MAAMVEIDALLSAAVVALRMAGFDPDVRDAPRRWRGDALLPAAWVRMPGDNAYAVVAVIGMVRANRPGTWRETYSQETAAAKGLRVSFHERPFRTRGHPYADSVDDVCVTSVEDVVAVVREHSEWEKTWSVAPVVEPARRRLLHGRRLAASKLDSERIPVGFDIDPLMLALLDGNQVDALHAVIEQLFVPGLRWRFPRDKNGSKLAGSTQVLLYECAPPANPAGRGVWLVADGPTPRGEQALTLRLVRVVGKSALHRWDTMPEYWRTGPRTLDQMWGIEAATTAGFVAEVTDMLLAGRIGPALAMCGVRVDEGTTRLLAGRPTGYELRQWTDKWVTNAVKVLVDAAPWRWHQAVPARQRPRRLASLGGYNPNRRPGLFLEYRDAAPLLSFDQSASPLVAARVAWQRDIDYDLIRLGLLTRDRVPVPPPSSPSTEPPELTWW
jgi:hypothetical protein